MNIGQVLEVHLGLVAKALGWKVSSPVFDGASSRLARVNTLTSTTIPPSPCGNAILISERIAKDDVFTSIHINKHETEARDTKLGAEEITRDIPNVSPEALKNLDEDIIITPESYAILCSIPVPTIGASVFNSGTA